MDERLPGRDETPLWVLAVMAAPAISVLALAVLTPTAGLFPNQGDVDLYRRIAAQVLAGAQPYSEVQLPYPPLALVPMVLPAAVWLPRDPSLAIYKVLFGAWEAGLLLVLAWVTRRLAEVAGARERDSAIRLAVLALLAIFPLTFRFDLFPTVLAAAALLVALEDRPVASGVALAFGTLAKLFPVVLAPAAGLRWALRRRASLLQFGLAIAIALAVTAVPFVLSSGTAMGQVLGYQADRGLELESLGSSLALAVAVLGGPPARVYSGFSSMNVDSTVARAWLDLDPWLTLAAFAAIAGLMARRLWLARADGTELAPLAIVRFATLTLVALLLVNKVFSVQYVVWLLPFAALLPWRPFALAAVAVALSTAIHPYLFTGLMAQDAAVVGVLLLRNVLVVALGAWLAVDAWRARVAPNAPEGRD